MVAAAPYVADVYVQIASAATLVVMSFFEAPKPRTLFVPFVFDASESQPVGLLTPLAKVAKPEKQISVGVNVALVDVTEVELTPPPDITPTWENAVIPSTSAIYANPRLFASVRFGSIVIAMCVAGAASAAATQSQISDHRSPVAV